jgi:hypothetical protein
MPSPDAAVGLVQYPLAPGATDSAIGDPLLEGLASWFQVWLNQDLNPKLQNINGMTGAMAVTPGNVFYWNPFARPHAMFLRGKQDGKATAGLPVWAPLTNFLTGTIATLGASLVLCTEGGETGASGTAPSLQTNTQVSGATTWAYLGPISAGVPKVPALFLWRDGSKPGSFSTLLDIRETQVKVAWVWNSLLLPGTWTDRYGIYTQVDASLQRAMSIGHHPNVQADSSIAVLLGLAKDGIWITKSEYLLIGPIVSPGGPADQPITRGFPAVVITMTAQEGIQLPTNLPSEQPADLQLGINVVDDTDPRGPLTVLNEVVPAGPYADDT